MVPETCLLHFQLPITEQPSQTAVSPPYGVLSNQHISALMSATVLATEEAIINALIAAETMVGRDGRRVVALPHLRLREILRKYNRLNE